VLFTTYFCKKSQKLTKLVTSSLLFRSQYNISEKTQKKCGWTFSESAQGICLQKKKCLAIAEYKNLVKFSMIVAKY